MSGMWRNDDHDTSKNAKVFGLTEDRALVLDWHVRRPQGLTDYELAAYTGRQQNSVGKRRTELFQAGYVDKTDMRRPAPSGSGCIVWRVNSRGFALHAQEQARKEMGL